ncbi:MAG TPA: hypothetical protein VFE28_03400 [Candidatus Krumholzibacteria bacterium]|nr:hypothetical protein [Candidatus Krumholzibacteria bacterium]
MSWSVRIESKPRLLALGLAPAVLLHEAAARACPACAGSMSGTAKGAYLASTAVLSLLPLGIIAAGVWLLRRAHRRASVRAVPPGQENAGRTSRRFRSVAAEDDAASA